MTRAALRKVLRCVQTRRPVLAEDIAEEVGLPLGPTQVVLEELRKQLHVRQFKSEEWVTVPDMDRLIYRMLRDMEERGLVNSRWDTSNAGPARRMYRLTEEGDRYLAWWVEDLRETDRVLHHFLETYGLHMRDNH